MKTPRPGLSYQYTPEGELAYNDSDEWITIAADAPAQFRADFLARWAKGQRDPEACWVRLQELVQAMPATIVWGGAEEPNPARPTNMWLVGLAELTEEIIAGIAEHEAQHAAKSQAQVEAEAAKAALIEQARATGQRVVVTTWLTNGCRRGAQDCSFDAATKYVLPDGSEQIEYRCCH